MHPCLRTLLALLLLIGLTTASTPAPSTIDFCPLTCYDVYTDTTHTNSGCDCTDGSDCVETAVLFSPNKTEEKIIVKFHNDLRARVASGKEFRGQNKGGATDMHALAYDQNLEYVAGCWAKKCNGTHDHCRRTDKFEKVGQNFYIGKDTECTSVDILKMAMDSWYHEINSVTEGCIAGYSACMTVGHYLQLVWAKTTHVGCAMAQMPGPNCHLFCNYGPSGNIVGEAVYTLGQPGTDCPARDKDYRMLCASKRPNLRAAGHTIRPRVLALVLVAFFPRVWRSV